MDSSQKYLNKLLEEIKKSDPLTRANVINHGNF